MPSTEYTRESIDAWLAGNLTLEESMAMESYFQRNPEMVEIERDAYDSDGPDETTFSPVVPDASDSELISLVARMKSGLSRGPRSPDREEWREIVTSSDKPGLLGTLHEYEIVDVIAPGAMGIVLKAFDPALDRFVAIKVLSPDAAANATSRERFLREARAGARLEHENILPIHEVCEDPVPWFAMRYVDGGNLQNRLDAGETFEADSLRSLGRQIALGLAAAHEKGMIHRDIKPANILLEREGDRIWVADFGIVRCVEDPSLTYAGVIAGTPRFMSPEQAAGGDLDERSDLFSLGLVLFYCATGESLLTGKTTAAVIAELGSGKRFANLRKLGHLPAWQRSLVSLLLEPDRDARPASASIVAEAFDAESFPSATAKPKRRQFAVGLVALVAALALITAYFWSVVFEKQRGGSVLIEETGQRFKDLAEALESIDGKSTLRLAGDLNLNREVWPEHEVVLEGDPESRPTVTVGFSDKHAVYFFQPFQMRDIRWIRAGGKLGSLPVIGSNVGRGQSLIEDCEFILPPRSNGFESGGRALGITGSSDAIVRRCRFETNGGNGLYLATKGTGNPTTTVRVEDCLFTGYAAVEVYRWEDPGEIRLSMENNVVVSDVLFLADRCDPLPNLALDLSQNVFNTRFSVFLLRDIPFAGNGKRIRWSGTGNLYNSGAHWLYAAPLVRPDADFASTTLKKRDEFARADTEFSDTADTQRPLPPRQPELAPPTPGDLIGGLQLPPDSSLRTSLETLEKNRISF